MESIVTVPRYIDWVYTIGEEVDVNIECGVCYPIGREV